MSAQYDIHNKPMPTPDPESKAFWDGLKAGKLLLQHCKDCGQIQYIQQVYCRQCQSANLEHRPASGKGTIYTFSTVYRAVGPAFENDVPYSVVLVELAEGPRMISSMIDTKPEDVKIGAPVQFVAEKVSDAVTLPRFKLAKAS